MNSFTSKIAVSSSSSRPRSRVTPRTTASSQHAAALLSYAQTKQKQKRGQKEKTAVANYFQRKLEGNAPYPVGVFLQPASYRRGLGWHNIPPELRERIYQEARVAHRQTWFEAAVDHYKSFLTGELYPGSAWWIFRFNYPDQLWDVFPYSIHITTPASGRHFVITLPGSLVNRNVAVSKWYHRVFATPGLTFAGKEKAWIAFYRMVMRDKTATPPGRFVLSQSESKVKIAHTKNQMFKL